MSNTEDCKNRRESIVALVLGELEPSGVQELQEHMRDCRDCQSFYSSIQEQERSVQSAFEQLSETLGSKDDAFAATLARRREQSRGTDLTHAHDVSGMPARSPWIIRFTRWAVAALLLVSTGYVAGRASRPEGPNAEQLVASVTPMVTEAVLAEVEYLLRSSTETSYARLRRDLDAQLRRAIGSATAQTSVACEAEMDRRLTELTRVIAATRALDRRRIAEAFEHIEANRLEDKDRFRRSLVTVAAQVNEPVQQKPN